MPRKKHRVLRVVPRGPSRKADARGFTMAKLEKVAAASTLAAAREMVDSEFMLKRCMDGDELTGTFVDLDESVTVSVIAKKYSLHGLCTCECTWFCEHAAALVLTWLEKPETFVDVSEYLDALGERPREELLEMLRTLIGFSPMSALEVLGRPGFQPAEVLDKYRDLCCLDADDEDWDDEEDDEDDDHPHHKGRRGKGVN